MIFYDAERFAAFGEAEHRFREIAARSVQRASSEDA